MQQYWWKSTMILHPTWYMLLHIEFRISLQLFPTLENSSESGEGPSVGRKLIHVFNDENSVHRCYCNNADDRFDINDVVQFKLMVESLPRIELSKIYLKFTLLFASLHSYSH